ncbi:MAG: hypothetical protein R3320_04645 [Nitriliruptorales bacterium]|nr:hypothetical protein [Nitriliruptorales bacterium]
MTWVPQGTVDKAARRVTTIATWTDDNETKTVWESTTIANAERGLPVPNFAVQPSSESTTVKPGFSSSEACPTESRFDHLLTNIGAPDSYEVRISHKNADSGEVKMTTASIFTSDATDWQAEVYLTPAGEGEDPPPDPKAAADDPGDDTVRMKDDSPVGDKFVEAYDSTDAEVRIGTGGSAYLTFCYVPIAGENPKNANFVVTVRSRFDNEIKKTLTHDIIVANTALTLYLHDPDNTKDHVRKSGIYGMDPNATTVTSGPFDYDKNVDPDTLDGLWLKDGDSTVSVVWDYQTTSEITVQQASLSLYAALAAADSNDAAIFDVKLRHVRENGTTVEADLSPASQVSVTPGGPNAFVNGTLDWTFSPVTLAAKERLRLTLTCNGNSDDDCHVLYDHANFLANLKVQG